MVICGPLRLENVPRMPPPVCARVLPLRVPSRHKKRDHVFATLDDVDILKQAVARIAKGVADHENDNLAVPDALLHRLH